MKKFLVTLLSTLFLISFLSACTVDQEDDGPDIPPPFTVIILQAYGTGNASDGAVSHSFIELYNSSNKDLSMTGYSVQYASGISAANETVSPWKVFDLSGKTIKAKSSFLILGKDMNTEPALQLPDSDADARWDIEMSNRSFKICLVKGTVALTVDNPFNTDGNGKKISGYVDMLGAVNDPSVDSVDAYEGEVFSGISKQKSARRLTVADADKNATDFENIDYRTGNTPAQKIEVCRPKNTAYGAWEPEYTVSVDQPYHPLAGKLMIFQVAGSTDGAISNSFVELYNNSDEIINLSEYCLQISSHTGAQWEVIPLTGKTIAARSSFLILGERSNGGATLVLENSDADLVADFSLSNRAFKVCLVQSGTPLTAANPFDTGEGGKSQGYVDMLGAINDSAKDSIDGFEVSPYEGVSKQKSCRRKTLTDTDNNAWDFEEIDFRIEANAENYRPRNTQFGAWNPITFATL